MFRHGFFLRLFAFYLIAGSCNTSMVQLCSTVFFSAPHLFLLPTPSPNTNTNSRIGTDPKKTGITITANLMYRSLCFFGWVGLGFVCLGFCCLVFFLHIADLIHCYWSLATLAPWLADFLMADGIKAKGGMQR